MEDKLNTHVYTPFVSKACITQRFHLDRSIIIQRLKTVSLPLLLWVGFVLFLSLVQFSTPDLPDNDGYYHIKLAYLMRTEGLKPDFTWLPLSILNARDFYDHHFLFHVGLIPFTFGDLRTGAKLAAVFFSSLAFLSTWILLRNQRIAYSALWALGLLAVSEAFIYRMSITRAQSLSLAVLMLGLDFLLRKKTISLAVLAFLYVWLYDAFPLLLVITGIYILSTWITERSLNLRPLYFAGLGTILGMLINPYFPHNLVFSVLHILPKLFETTSVSVGNEWYPYDTAQLLKNSSLALVAFASGALALGLSGKRLDLRTLVSFVLTAIFGVMLLQSRRFIEYFPAFSLIFAAFAWSPILEKWTAESTRQTMRWLPATLLSLVLIPGIGLTFQAARSSIQNSKPYQTYANASTWLAQNSPAGSMVFQTDWDDFPRLFFYNTHNTYLIGLDPTYMHINNPALYSRWVNITKGNVKDIAKAVGNEFGSDYILTDLLHEGFIDQAAMDPGLVEMYRDEYAIVYLVKVNQ